MNFQHLTLFKMHLMSCPLLHWTGLFGSKGLISPECAATRSNKCQAQAPRKEPASLPSISRGRPATNLCPDLLRGVLQFETNWRQCLRVHFLKEVKRPLLTLGPLSHCHYPFCKRAKENSDKLPTKQASRDPVFSTEEKPLKRRGTQPRASCLTGTSCKGRQKL